MHLELTANGKWQNAGWGNSDTGIVLAGGGSYGAYELGVMRALFEGQCPHSNRQPLNPRLFAGTSVGAVNAALIVSRAEAGLPEAVKIVENIWLEEIAEKPGRGNGLYRLRGVPPFLNGNCLHEPLHCLGQAARDGLYLFRESIAAGRRFFQHGNRVPARRLLEAIDLTAFFDLTPFRRLLPSILPLEEIARSSRKLQVIATNFDTGQISVFGNAEIGSVSGYDALMASAAVPLFFPPVRVAGDLHIDGGTLQNSPILPAVHSASMLHVVYMDPDVENMPLADLDNTIGLLDRLLVTNWAYNISQEIAVVSDYNQSLDFLRSRGTLPRNDDPLMEQLFKAGDAVAGIVADRTLWSRTTIHQYHPTDDLGDITGFLDFRPDRIKRLIDRGYEDTIHHDCERSRCILPGESSW